MLQIRRGVFETNSSSTHSLSICTAAEFQMFIDGHLMYDSYRDEFVDSTKVGLNVMDIDNISDDYRYLTYDEFWSQDDVESYSHHFRTPSGDDMVAFGVYGWG